MSLFRSIWDDLQYSLRVGNMVTKLVVVNFAVFVLLKLIYLVMSLITMGQASEMYDTVLNYLTLPADLSTLAWHLWSFISHMFLHDSFWPWQWIVKALSDGIEGFIVYHHSGFTPNYL